MSLIDFAKGYRGLGWAVQEQLEAVLDGQEEEVNPAALEMINDFLAEHGGDDDPSDRIEFAKAYNDLGWAVQEQLEAVLDGREEEVNPAALDAMNDMAQQFSGYPDPDLEEFVETVTDAHKRVNEGMAAARGDDAGGQSVGEFLDEREADYVAKHGEDALQQQYSPTTTPAAPMDSMVGGDEPVGSESPIDDLAGDDAGASSSEYVGFTSLSDGLPRSPSESPMYLDEEELAQTKAAEISKPGGNAPVLWGGGGDYSGKDYSALTEQAAAASAPKRGRSGGRRDSNAGMRQGGAGTPNVRIVRR